MPRQHSKFSVANDRDRYMHDRSMQPVVGMPVTPHQQYRHKSEQQDLYRQPDDDFEMIPIKKHKRRERHGTVFVFYVLEYF